MIRDKGLHARAKRRLKTIGTLAVELLGDLDVTSERCAGCGQHTQPAKSIYQAQKQLESIIRQTERLAVMESAGLLPWKGEKI